MPEIETQTDEEFKILSDGEVEKLTRSQKKIYKNKLKMFNKEKKKAESKEKKRLYHLNYTKMRYKYDPNYRKYLNEYGIERYYYLKEQKEQQNPKEDYQEKKEINNYFMNFV